MNLFNLRVPLDTRDPFDNALAFLFSVCVEIIRNKPEPRAAFLVDDAYYYAYKLVDLENNGWGRRNMIDFQINLSGAERTVEAYSIELGVSRKIQYEMQTTYRGNKANALISLAIEIAKTIESGEPR